MKKHNPAPKKPHSSHGEQWIYGKHASLAAMKNPKRVISRILVNRNAQNDIAIPENLQHKTQLVDNKMIESLLPAGSVHQGIAVQSAPLPETSLEDFCSIEKAHSVVVLLDQVTDPHNVGAVLRSAAAFGADAVITTTHNAPQETGTLAKSASGTLELVPLIRVTNLASAIDMLKTSGYWVLGLDGYAETTLNKVTPYAKTALILGSEEKGMRRLTREHCDILVKLPISDAVESLNVSNAAAISLYALASMRL
jgi:23S rRNA (guanosine2251-2'-O)-methyltransferase